MADDQLESRRWDVTSVCPHCGGAIRFMFSSASDWDYLNIVIVSVSVHRDTNLAVTQRLHHDSWMDRLRQEKRSSRVPKVVNPHRR